MTVLAPSPSTATTAAKHRKLRRMTALLGALGLALATGAVPLVEAPLAGAQTDTHRTVSGGTFNWGFRDSFLNYITGPIAHGSYEYRNGAGFSNNEFTFPATANAASISSDSTGVIPLDGELYFSGHGGALDITINDLKLSINGNHGQLITDYQSFESDFTTTGPEGRGAPNNGNDEVLVDITFNQPIDFSSDTIDLSGSTSLGAGGLNLFGTFYGDDPYMDDTSGQFSLTDAAGPAPSVSGGTGTGTGTAGNRGQTDSGATEGVAGLLGQINDTFIEVNGLLVNTDNVLNNADILANRNSGGTTGAAGTTAASGASGASGTAGKSGTSTTSGTSGTSGTSRASGTSGTANSGTSAGSGAAPSTNAAVCSADGAVGVQSAEALWGVRQSFRTYIEGSIANGGWELTNVGESGTQFVFSGNSGAVNPGEKSGTILFPGTIRFTGHGGILDTRLSNLEIQFSGTSGSLIADVTSNSVEGQPNDYGRITLATLGFDQLDVSSSSASGTASTTLTQAGSDAFGSFYPAGDPLDPISFTAQLGGDPNCAAGQGGGASGSGTGTGDAGAAAALRGTGGTSGTSGAGANGVTGAESANSANGANGNQFQIKSASSGNGGWNDNAGAMLILLLAGIVIAGGSMTSFIRNNPLG